MEPMERIIYDIGANTGDDIPYYLLRAERVVAVEANPALCDQMRDRFAAEIGNGRVVVENCVISDRQSEAEVDFFVHKGFHIWSQFPAPAPEVAHEFERTRLASRFIVDLIQEHGLPHYLKIDVERFDAPLLMALFSAGIRPPFVSAECVSFEIPAILWSQGGYRAFKLLDAQSVSRVYRRRVFEGPGGEGRVEFSFPFHSAGPFGNDIDGPWMDADQVVELIGVSGFGWRDLHATTTTQPTQARSRHQARLSKAAVTRALRVVNAKVRRALRLR